VRKVGGGVKSRSEPVPQQHKRDAGPEQLSFDLNRGEALPISWSFLFPFFFLNHELFVSRYNISKKRRLHPDMPCAPCASGGPGA